MSPVRHGAPGELAALASIHAAAFDRNWSAEALGELLSIEQTVALVAGPEGDPRGFLLLRGLGEDAEILTLAVRPADRRQGIALALVAEAAATALSWKAERIWLEVAAGNSAAQALYSAAGYETVGRRRGYYKTADGGGEDALMLRLVLNRPAGSAYAAAP